MGSRYADDRVYSCRINNIILYPASDQGRKNQRHLGNIFSHVFDVCLRCILVGDTRVFDWRSLCIACQFGNVRLGECHSHV